MEETFNIVLAGTGGQGLITLTRILSIAALNAGLDVKTSELHGLSQRGGSVETHIKIGEKVFSPLVTEGRADLVIALELQEIQKACYYGYNERTVFLVNNFIIPTVTEKGNSSIEQGPSEANNFSKKIIFISANKMTEEKLGNSILSGVFMISFASFKGFLPLKPEEILKAIKEVVPDKHLKLNKKAFDLAKKYNG